MLTHLQAHTHDIWHKYLLSSFHVQSPIRNKKINQICILFSSWGDQRHKSLEWKVEVDNSNGLLGLYCAPGIFHLAFIVQKSNFFLSRTLRSSPPHISTLANKNRVFLTLHTLKSTGEDTEVFVRMLKCWGTCWSTGQVEGEGGCKSTASTSSPFFSPWSPQDNECLIHWTK